MNLKCRQGDLAIIIKSKAGNEGKVIACVKYVSTPPLFDLCGNEPYDYWEIDRALTSSAGRQLKYIHDSWLLPIGKKVEERARELEYEGDK